MMLMPTIMFFIRGSEANMFVCKCKIRKSNRKLESLSSSLNQPLNSISDSIVNGTNDNIFVKDEVEDSEELKKPRTTKASVSLFYFQCLDSRF